jgi:hypothetical protein
MTVPRCPTCHQRLFQQCPDGKAKLRTNIVIFASDGQSAIVKCPGCKGDVPLDVQLGEALRAALGVQPKRLVVPKVLDSKDPAT